MSAESAFDAGKDNTLILSEVKTDGMTLGIPATITGLKGHNSNAMEEVDHEA